MQLQKENVKSPAEIAREKAGYGGRDGLKRAARKLGYAPRLVRRIERNGGGSERYCFRAANLFRCSGELFFFHPNYFQENIQIGNFQQSK